MIQRAANWLLCASALLIPATGWADAIMRTQAMYAETIAEIYVTDNELRLDLEIGMADVKNFRNLLPDEIYRGLGFGEQPWAERLQSFFATDFVFRPDGGPALAGQLARIGPAERQQRDAVTGEVLPVAEGDAVDVLRARLVYPLEKRPAELFFGVGPELVNAGIGFVAYHRSIAVNDFRYLTPNQNLLLDWVDPFYTKFAARTLRRTYFAPMSGFIYVEPYEVRKEIIVRPKDLQQWVDLGLAGKTIISAAEQPELLRRAGEFLRARQPVLVDGVAVEPELARINFLERTLKTSRVIDPPVDLDIDVAIIGVIFVYPTVAVLPQTVTMEWDMFNERVQIVPGSAVDQAGPMPIYLEPDAAILEWQNFLKNPELPTLVDLTVPPSDAQRMAAYLQWIMLVLSGWMLWRWFKLRGNRSNGRPALAAASALLLTGITFWMGASTRLSVDATNELVSGVLHNIYRAFDFRDESQIYDVLDQTVAGDLLTDIYLETRRGLELANQGGARAKVKDIELQSLAAEPGADGAIEALVTWQVSGSVGHWGHVHRRQNQYEARLIITPVNGRWKLTAMELLSEERI